MDREVAPPSPIVVPQVMVAAGGQDTERCVHVRGVRRHPLREVDHDEGRRSGRRDDGLLSGVVILIQAHACTSDPVVRVQAPFPRTQGRLLSCGFLPAGPRNASRSDVDIKPQFSPPGNGRVCHRTGKIGGKVPGTWHANAPKQRPFPPLWIHGFLPKKTRQRQNTEYQALGVPPSCNTIHLKVRARGSQHSKNEVVVVEVYGHILPIACVFSWVFFGALL